VAILVLVAVTIGVSHHLLLPNANRSNHGNYSSCHHDLSQLRQRALSRWDNDGGVEPRSPPQIPLLTDSDLVQLRIRVVALENLVIALLAEASDRQLDLVREMAAYISPRPGFTQHHLTIHAAAHMIDPVERAGHFRVEEP
jgi:hypothetical protein